jgi:hypothetical protein
VIALSDIQSVDMIESEGTLKIVTKSNEEYSIGKISMKLEILYSTLLGLWKVERLDDFVIITESNIQPI